MIHALTIDVEDFHNLLARDHLGREMPPTRAVVENTQRLLTLFAERNVRVTFFVLGEVAATYPQLIRDIASGDHELGVHGYYHRQVFKLNAASFRKEICDAKDRIQDITGCNVLGHRAPAFSITPDTRWALDVLAEAGFRYDSSVFPISGRRYGWPGFRQDIHTMQLAGGRSIIEAPLSTVTVLGKRLPVCGGGYFRHFPFFLTSQAFRSVQKHRPAIFYAHPYEIELGSPPPDVSGLDAKSARRVRRFHAMQLRNRDTVEGKIDKMLDRFSFGPLAEVIETSLGTPIPCN